MKRGQKRSRNQKKRDARYLRWRNLRDNHNCVWSRLPPRPSL